MTVQDQRLNAVIPPSPKAESEAMVTEGSVANMCASDDGAVTSRLEP